MATLNLGRIKPVFRGAYAGGTAYVVDDIVTSGNETFICILASTGNATSNATYWTKLAAKGTDGTDVGATLTTQGDILYRDGSGLQRLAKPASDKFLQNTSGGVVSWESLSSDWVKVASSGEISATGSISVDGHFSSDYKVFKLFIENAWGTSGGDTVVWRMKTTGSYTEYSSSNYYYIINVAHRNSGGNSDSSSGGWATSYGRVGWSGDGSTSGYSCKEFTIYNPSSSVRKIVQCHWNGYDNGWWSEGTSGCIIHESASMTGFKLYHGAGNIGVKGWTLYGIK